MTTAPAGVAICIPVLNDRVGIADVIPRVGIALDGTPHTICVVDDGSRDGTLTWLDQWMSEHSNCHVMRRQKTRPGCLRGAATRAGLGWLAAHTSHEIFVDLDADGAHRPEEIPVALAHLAAHAACDVVIASKYVRGSRVTGRSLTRRAGSLTYNALLRRGLSASINDFSNSFRFYRRAAAERVLRAPTRYDTPVFLVEMMAIWLSAGLRIDELPTLYEERVGGQSKVGWRDAVDGFAGAIDVITRVRMGKYRTR